MSIETFGRKIIGARTTLLMAVMVSATAGLAVADTHYVWRDNPNTPVPPYTNGWASASTEIQLAVDAAASGDLVLVTNGIYDTGGRSLVSFGALPEAYGTETNRVLIYDKSIVVRSVNGPEFTIIKGQPDGATGTHGEGAVRCVSLFTPARSLMMTLGGFTLSNGYTAAAGDLYWRQSGGGAHLAGGILSNCVIVANAGSYGGGGVIMINDGSVTGACTIAFNKSGTFGGGAWMYYGGSVYDATIYCNTSTYGGGVMAYPGGVSTVTGCAISNNTALTAYGGGAYVHGANAKIKNSRLFNNLASVALGGGVYFSGGGTVENCLLIGNRSGTTMGGNAHFEGGGTMNNCTLSKGSASAGSGARMNGGAMNNCIVWGNNVDDLSVAAGTVSYTCSKVKASGTGNIDTDPRFVNTNAWDFHLRGYSPCVDQGTMLSWTSSSIDLDGRKRINGAVDMGAFEYYSSGTLIFIR